MRLTFYTRVTPQLFQKRGKNLFKNLASLKNFVSQSNRKEEFGFIIKKQDLSEENEIYASLKNTNFADLVESINEHVPEEPVIQDEESETEQDTQHKQEVIKNAESIIEEEKKEEIPVTTQQVSGAQIEVVTIEQNRAEPEEPVPNETW